MVPTNYRHVEINPLLLDWRLSARNYKEIVTLAVDSETADGHAFVTEYAGPSSLVPVQGLFDERWDASAFSRLTPSELLAELETQGFGGCVDDVCEWSHPLASSLILSFLPPPEGVEPDAFLSCLECYDEFVDMDAWDPVVVAEAFEERIVAPARRALEIVQTYPYLTRMYTTLSPHEMTQDPFFHENPDLPPLDLTSVAASITRPCSGAESATVPSATTSFSFSAWDLDAWPEFTNMPFAVRVEEIPEVGAPITLADNEEAIREALAQWEGSQVQPVQPRCTDWPGDEPGADDDAAGCGCRADASTPWSGLLTLGLIGVWARRRRRN